ncbi:Peptidoglycan/LPS O-acetylase OafA/YrhL, contains acyltransferase and SGNH-hydrolase domains [Chryseobacterium sp. RU37D]|uniref:acyltransferase family protein n=1 Tax=Chryseobacterium sp. RU37D TaxID=1907397 RepID=UPI000955FD70|nr:acyltransferase [Chryseobacterium sp. RU37D]SIQ04879.1 Peptidoglycan/LPS O-acetylase OafA/YrhL, contains acyltransferase and SGNH-hydrolase domains [Chryseobacterium sp. RU37D]
MKITQITFTRFIAAVAIVIYHFRGDLFVFKIKYISGIFTKANIGVSYFFILSGFIMIIAYHCKQKIDSLEFYKNRLARIYPLYIIGMLLFMIAVLKADFLAVILYLMGLQSWIPGDALILNFPGWSISVEFFFYLIFPFLYNYIYLKKNNFIWVAAILIWIATQVFCNYYMEFLYEGRFTKGHDFIHYFPLLHLNEFLVGNLAGLYFVKNFRQKNYDWAIILVFSAILLSIIFIPLFYHNGLMAVFFIPLIILISLNNGFLTKIFSLKPFEYLGEISYAIYIIHIPILRVLRTVLKKTKIDMDYNLQFAVFMIILLISAAFCYHFIEKPLRDHLRKIRIK